ncbi:serine/threonine-protein kinase [Shewanella vesiculosa]|uniref:non-specific serine/threonine protein kinase n=1 Tax=Shewanella vesiculosa TaxID=518738 RepID=A0ABV0FRX1_9GAMM
MSLGQIGKYELLKHLGNGAFGDVFLAHDHALNTQKAIKVLNAPDANDVMKNLEEAQILHKCMHKNIVHINEANVFEINSVSHVVIDMEYLPLGSFEDAIETNSVSIHGTIRFIIDCLFALEHAHINGILHRDVKPANIMLCDFGAKLSDFGLATVLGLQAAGSPKGYTTHLPPEYFIRRHTTELTDIFAVGITLFRACNYISDWDGTIRRLDNPDGLIRSGRLVNALGFTPFIPQKLKRVINKACAANPDQRYQSTSEFRQALERLTPQIDWVPTDHNSFHGTCVQTGVAYSVALISTRTEFTVEIKKNGRRQGSACKSFNDLNQANKYLFDHVSSTLFR